MRYELWDTESRNLLYDFGTEAEALDAVRELTKLNRPSYPGALALTLVEADGRMTTVALGEELAQRVGTAETEDRPLCRSICVRTKRSGLTLRPPRRKRRPNALQPPARTGRPTVSRGPCPCGRLSGSEMMRAAPSGKRSQ